MPMLIIAGMKDVFAPLLPAALAVYEPPPARLCARGSEKRHAPLIPRCHLESATCHHWPGPVPGQTGTPGDGETFLWQASAGSVRNTSPRSSRQWSISIRFITTTFADAIVLDDAATGAGGARAQGSSLSAHLFSAFAGSPCESEIRTG